jgi:hypothetical protein
MWTEQIGVPTISGPSIGSVAPPFGSASLFFQGVAEHRGQTSLSLSFDSPSLCQNVPHQISLSSSLSSGAFLPRSSAEQLDSFLACAHSPDIDYYSNKSEPDYDIATCEFLTQY